MMNLILVNMTNIYGEKMKNEKFANAVGELKWQTY